jgi:hypothetical protein
MRTCLLLAARAREVFAQPLPGLLDLAPELLGALAPAVRGGVAAPGPPAEGDETGSGGRGRPESENQESWGHYRDCREPQVLTPGGVSSVEGHHRPGLSEETGPDPSRDSA